MRTSGWLRCWSALRPIIIGGFLILASGEARAATTCTFTNIGATMRLNASCTTDATISVPHGKTLDGAGHTIYVTDPPGDHFKGAVIRNAGTLAHVRRLTIVVLPLVSAPCDFGPGTTGEDRLRGIAFFGASGSIKGNRIFGLNQGPGDICNEGTGILAHNDPRDGTHPDTKFVTIEGNQIVDVQQFGVAVQGDVKAGVEDNFVELYDEVGALQQAGVIASAGVIADVRENTVKGGFRDGNVSDPIGVWVLEASGVGVVGNRITSVREGIYVQSFCQRVQGANRNKVLGNFITGVAQGILLVARAQDLVSFCDAHVDQNLVSLNAIKRGPNITPLSGIFYAAQVISGTFVPVVDRNAITFNAIVGGFAVPIFNGGGATNTFVFKNLIQP